MQTTTLPAAGTILALDLGKFKSVACAYDAATGELGFATIVTCRGELQRLFERYHPGHQLKSGELLAAMIAAVAHMLIGGRMLTLFDATARLSHNLTEIAPGSRATTPPQAGPGWISSRKASPRISRIGSSQIARSDENPPAQPQREPEQKVPLLVLGG